MPTPTIAPLSQKDAARLAPLIAAYAQAMKRGAPRSPDQYYAELLTADRTAEVLGAFVGPQLVGFAVFFDLPDTTTGHRTGQLDDIYVQPDHRLKGIGRALVDALKAEGGKRGWTRLRWIVPKPVDAIASGDVHDGELYDALGRLSEARLYEITVDPVS